MSKSRKNKRTSTNRTNNQEGSAVVRRASLSYSGPLPPVEQMNGYGTIDPSFPDRIMNMAEKEAQHRHKFESSIVNKAFWSDQLNNFFAFLSLIVILVFCGWLVNLGHVEDAKHIAIALIVGVVGIFVIRRYRSSTE